MSDSSNPQAGASSPAPAGSAAGMCLGERAHREAFEWDAFSFSEDPGVRGQLRMAYKEGFMRGFNTCAAMSLPVSTLADEVLRVLCPEGYDPEESEQVHEAIRRILSPNAQRSATREEPR